MMNAHWYLLWLIGIVPILRRRYLDSLQWKLSADQGQVIFNKPVPPNCRGSFVYARQVESESLAVMQVWVGGQQIKPSQQWQFMDTL